MEDHKGTGGSTIRSTMKRGLGNMKQTVKDFYQKLRISLKLEKKRTEIPESWTKPKWSAPLSWLFDKDSIPVKKNPVARKPMFSFDVPKRDLRFFRSNMTFKIKRSVMFLLLIACLISIFSFSVVNPLSLLFYLPTVYICLDFLRKTRTKKRKVWLLLKDLEEDT